MRITSGEREREDVRPERLRAETLSDVVEIGALIRGCGERRTERSGFDDIANEAVGLEQLAQQIDLLRRGGLRQRDIRIVGTRLCQLG